MISWKDENKFPATTTAIATTTAATTTTHSQQKALHQFTDISFHRNEQKHSDGEGEGGEDRGKEIVGGKKILKKQ